jgi:hypothetical protein
MSDAHRTPSKIDSKPAAHSDNEDSSQSPEPNLAKSTQKQLKEQGEKHAMKIAAMKRANLDTQNL